MTQKNFAYRMKHHRYLHIIIFYCSTIVATGFFYSSTRMVFSSPSITLKRIQQSVDIQFQAENKTETTIFRTLEAPPGFFSYLATNSEHEKKTTTLESRWNEHHITRTSRKLQTEWCKHKPTARSFPTFPALFPINDIRVTRISKLQKKTFPHPQEAFAKVVERAKEFANRYLSKDEQLELHQAAARARAEGSTSEQIRQLVSQQLNGMLTPEEKRDIAAHMEKLKKDFGDDAFLGRS